MYIMYSIYIYIYIYIHTNGKENAAQRMVGRARTKSACATQSLSLRASVAEWQRYNISLHHYVITICL